MAKASPSGWLLHVPPAADRAARAALDAVLGSDFGRRIADARAAINLAAKANERRNRAAPPRVVAAAGRIGTAGAPLALVEDDALPDPGEDGPEAPTGAGTAAQPLPAKTTSAVDGRPARGKAHVWIVRGLGDIAVLLSLVLDRDGGHPDNCCGTARKLAVHRDTVRAHRDELLRRGLVVVADGYLIGTPAGREMLRRSDPMPRALLRGRGDRPSLAMLRACAVVYADAIGWRADRHGCRSDAERAALAGVSRRYVVAARALLAARGLVAIEELRRGRADLRRARLTEDRCGTHGRPMSDDQALRLADLARRGRARRRRGAEPRNTEGAEPRNAPIQSRRGTTPMQAPPAPTRTDGSEVASRLHGFQTAETTKKPGTATAGDVLAALVPGLPAALADRAKRVAVSSQRAAAELRRLAADPKTVPSLLRMPPPRAVQQVLEAAQVFDKAPKRRAGLALQVSRVLGVAQLLALACDVLLGRPRNVGVVLLARLKRALAGEAPASILTRCRASWPIGEFLEAVGGALVDAPASAAEATTRTAPSPTDPPDAPRLTFDQFAAAFMSRRTTA